MENFLYSKIKINTPPQFHDKNFCVYCENKTSCNTLISIVLASYNGIKYIKAQLDSIRKQKVIPDEVIINDDCSTDGTYEFCKEYICDYALKGWKVFRNDKNLGVCENFRIALSRCTGYYIFTCDQDDEWFPDKIQAMVSTLKNHSEINLLVSNYIPVVNEKRVRVPVKYLDGNDGTLIQYRLEDTWLDTMRPGCTYCFRRELLNMFNVFDDKNAIHDTMLWTYAIVSNSLYLLNSKLIY